MRKTLLTVLLSVTALAGSATISSAGTPDAPDGSYVTSYIQGTNRFRQAAASGKVSPDQLKGFYDESTQAAERDRTQARERFQKFNETLSKQFKNMLAGKPVAPGKLASVPSARTPAAANAAKPTAADSKAPKQPTAGAARLNTRTGKDFDVETGGAESVSF